MCKYWKELWAHQITRPGKNGYYKAQYTSTRHGINYHEIIISGSLCSPNFYLGTEKARCTVILTNFLASGSTWYHLNAESLEFTIMFTMYVYSYSYYYIAFFFFTIIEKFTEFWIHLRCLFWTGYGINHGIQAMPAMRGIVFTVFTW